MSEQAVKLTAYFGERARVGPRLLADALLDAQARHAIRLSVLLRGIQGFGAKHRLRTDRLLTLSEDLPLVSVAIDTRERIAALSRDLAALGGGGLVTVERACMVEERAGAQASAAGSAGASDTAGAAAGVTGIDTAQAGARAHVGSELKLTVCLGRHERVDGEPAFAAVCRVLRETGVSGATVLLGVDGTVHGQRRRARFFAGNRGVPMLVISVGRAETIERALAELPGVLPSLLYTLERVRVLKRDGTPLRSYADWGPPPDEGEQRRKLTIVVSEAARHAGRPVYLELVRRLRAEGAAGATSLRGIWGFHGEHPPHGDRLLSLRRHVPVLTEAIDTPQRSAALLRIVDELTAEHGLVTSELVPASAALNAPPGL